MRYLNPVTLVEGLAVVRKGSTITHYLNGEPNGGGATNLTPKDGEARFQLGAEHHDTYQRFFDGFIDEVRVWGRARTASQIKGNAWFELNGDEQDLRGYWQLNHSLQDRTIYANHLQSPNQLEFSDSQTVGEMGFRPDAVRWRAENGGNDHYYEVVDAGESITWVEAKSKAQQLGGYLATVSSAEENAFIFGLLPQSEHPYIGGYKDVDGWQWVSGEVFNYNNWEPGEPNSFNGVEENYLQIYGHEGTWNNLPLVSGPSKYVVEFE